MNPIGIFVIPIPILAVLSIVVIIFGRKQLLQYRKILIIIGLGTFLLFSFLSVNFAYALGDYAIGPIFLYFSPIVGIVLALDFMLFINIYLIFKTNSIKNPLRNIRKYFGQEKGNKQNLFITLGTVFLLVIIVGFAINLSNKQKYVRADLQSANFLFAKLQGYNFQGANLQDANFRSANLQGVNFNDANLQYADLYGAVICGATFQNANLMNANLQYADLSQVDFSGADLAGADLLNANLYDAIMPDGEKWTGETNITQYTAP